MASVREQVANATDATIGLTLARGRLISDFVGPRTRADATQSSVGLAKLLSTVTTSFRACLLDIFMVNIILFPSQVVDSNLIVNYTLCTPTRTADVLIKVLCPGPLILIDSGRAIHC